MTVWQVVWARLECMLTVGAIAGETPQRRRMKTIYTVTMMAALLYGSVFFSYRTAAISNISPI